jgi:HAMP domain-containing protein
MAQFSRTFPFVALISLGVAFLLSLSQLRRNLAPLRALQEGTRRLANQEFDQPVTVSSNDEFAELADSFNAMSAKIARQFDALVTTAEIDQAVLSAVDTNRIVRTVLDRMRSIYLCDMVGVMLVDPTNADSVTTYTDDGNPSGPEGHVTLLTGEDAKRLREEAEGFTLEGGPVPGYLTPLTGRGARTLVVMPLVYQGELLGAIALGGGDTIGRGEEELMQAKRVAGQVAPGARQRAHDRPDPIPRLLRQSHRPSQPGLLQTATGRGAGTEPAGSPDARRLLPRSRPLQPDQRHPGPPVR